MKTCSRRLLLRPENQERAKSNCGRDVWTLEATFKSDTGIGRVLYVSLGDETALIRTRTLCDIFFYPFWLFFSNSHFPEVKNCAPPPPPSPLVIHPSNIDYDNKRCIFCFLPASRLRMPGLLCQHVGWGRFGIPADACTPKSAGDFFTARIKHD